MHSYIYVLTLSSSGDFWGSSSNDNDDDDDDDDDPSRLWRVIEAPFLLVSIPLAINGVLYWFTSSHGNYYISSFDVTSENFYRTPLNLFDRLYASRRGFMNMGGYLAVWFVLPVYLTTDGLRADNYTFSVLVIEDLHNPGGEWKEMYRGVVMDPGFLRAYENASPSVGNGEVIIFDNYQGGPILAYNIKAQRWWQVVENNFKLPDDRVGFNGYHVEISVPFDSLFSLKQTTSC